MSLTALVCGGAGYIGSHVVAALLVGRSGAPLTPCLLQRADFKVVVVDNHLNWPLGCCKRKVQAFVQADIRDEVTMANVFDSFCVDVVVHMCADSLVGQSVTNPLKYYDNNVTGAIRLLKAMQRAGVKAIVFSSTAAVFGVPARVPILEEDPKNPTNPYGETKLAIERMLKWADEAYGIKYVALRYFNAAGAEAGSGLGERHNPETHLIPIVLKVLFGVPVPYSVREVIDMCRKVTGVNIAADESTSRPGDPPVLIARVAGLGARFLA